MAILARASALLALLPAVAGEAPLEQTSGECMASSMRVELLQKSIGVPAVALTEAQRTSLDLRAGWWEYPGREMSRRINALIKSTFAISSSHTGKNLAFKRFFFPVMTEDEWDGEERPDFLQLVQDAIDQGAALPDAPGHPASSFDYVAGHEECGKTARVRLATVLGDPNFATLSAFHFHGVFADGHHGSAESREVGGLTVRDVERIFQEELGNLTEYSPWMDIHVAIYDNDLDSYAHRFVDHSVPVLALRWPSADENLPSHFYSLLVHAPDTQEVFEIISTTAPSDTRLVVRDFPMTRHVFKKEELVLLTDSSGPTQLHISRSHYDLDAVKAHYKQFFQMEPIYEVRDAKTGVGVVSFWHQTVSPSGEDRDSIRVQVMYWNRPDQSMTVAHTTAWLDQRLEQINSQYMLSYRSCWPIWGDNHYTVTEVPADYFQLVRQKYDDAGIGYMLFRIEDSLYTAYFPMPGGMYLELQVDLGDLPAGDDVRMWHTTNEEGPNYCWKFTCPP